MMRSYYKNILLAATLLSTSAACTKENPGTSTLDGVPISISATAPETKALLNETTFQTSGNKIQVYDFVTSGTTTTKHIEDYVIAPKSEDPEYHWPFGSGTKHQWTAGTHKFFGWLKEDANMTSATDAAANTPDEFFGSDFKLDEANHTLTIPAKVMTASTPQFDFMYSDIHTRDMDSNPYYTAVPLKFSHLFSAVYVTARNKDSENSITINKITINGLNNVKSSTINFSGSEPVVNYSDDENKEEGGYEFTINSETGLLTTTAKPLTDTYLIWPQTKEDFANASITVECTFSEDDKQTNETRTVSLSTLTPVESNYIWAPGKVNALNIVFDIDQITFIIQELVPWNETEKDIPVEL